MKSTFYNLTSYPCKVKSYFCEVKSYLNKLNNNGIGKGVVTVKNKKKSLEGKLLRNWDHNRLLVIAVNTIFSSKKSLFG